MAEKHNESAAWVLVRLEAFLGRAPNSPILVSEKKAELPPENFFDSFLSRFSSLYMNTVADYGASYYVHNHLRHINSWYGFLIKFYYHYVACHVLIRPTKLSPQSTVLDIGCGIGLLAEQFDRLGHQVVGVDVNKAAIENSVYPKNCFLVETTSRLNYPDQYFDLVVSREVLEHIPLADIDDCIREWDRAGKGVMAHIIAVAERGVSATHDPTHVNVQVEQWWVDKFEAHGYVVTRKPLKMFLSPFGSSGYLVMVKDDLRRS